MSAELLPAETPIQLAKIEPIPTPVDELTGLPLLIEPHDDVPFLLANPRINAVRRAAGGRDHIDRNHVHHPERAPELTSSDGRAVQSSRVQWTMRHEHDDYHVVYSGPPLPRTRDERFRTVVFNLAKYVPRQALSFRGDSPKIVSQSDEQILRLQTSGEVQVMDQARARKFLQDCVLQEPSVDHIPVSLIDEFLAITPNNAYDLRRQQFLAHKLLSHIIDPATEPLYAAYMQTRKANLWHPGVSASPRHVVHNQLVGQGRYRRAQSIRKIGGVLFDKLAAYRELAPAA